VNIPLDRDKPVALARQIEAHLERLIREGLLAPGTKLPPTRELARTLAVNRATVALAYDELVAAGWAHAHVGQGTFVAASRDGHPPARRVAAERPAPREAPASAAIDWAGLLSRSARIVRADGERARAVMPPYARGGDLISFAGGVPDSGLFPTDAFRRVLNQVVREEGPALLQYASARGYPPLLRYLTQHLLRVGVEARPGRTFEGRVTRFSRALDPRTRTMRTEVLIEALAD